MIETWKEPGTDSKQMAKKIEYHRKSKGKRITSSAKYSSRVYDDYAEDR